MTYSSNLSMFLLYFPFGSSVFSQISPVSHIFKYVLLCSKNLHYCPIFLLFHLFPPIPQSEITTFHASAGPPTAPQRSPLAGGAPERGGLGQWLLFFVRQMWKATGKSWLFMLDIGLVIVYWCPIDGSLIVWLFDWWLTDVSLMVNWWSIDG